MNLFLANNNSDRWKMKNIVFLINKPNNMLHRSNHYNLFVLIIELVSS